MSISEHEAKVLSDFEAYEAEIDALRARVAELERGAETDKGSVALALETLLKSCARVAELECELDAARRVIETGGQLISHEARALEAEADAARPREALQRENMAACECGDDGHRMSTCSSCLRTANVDAFELEVIASELRRLAERIGYSYRAPARTAHLAPSAEPTPRDMRVAELERERDEAADEAAACLEFLRTLRDWHSFWEEGFLGEKTASASRQNGQALRAFLDETGHARRVVERIASLERDLAEARLRVCTTAIGCGKCERCRAVVDAARLREALGKWERVVRDFRAGCGSSRNADNADEALLAFAAALASAPSAEPEGPDYSGLCSAPECGGHCGYVHAVGCEAIREYLAEHGGAPYKAPARTAHLAPGAEPTPRDMRVAEAVREACFGIADGGEGGRDGVMQSIRAIDLAAVVAKVVGT